MRTEEMIGNQLRYLSGAITFGLWQHNLYAGIFCYFALITLGAE